MITLEQRRELESGWTPAERSIAAILTPRERAGGDGAEERSVFPAVITCAAGLLSMALVAASPWWLLTAA